MEWWLLTTGAMKRTAALVLATAIVTLSACKKPEKVRALVSCNEHTQGFLCNVTTAGGGAHNVNVCWDIDVACADGQKLAANSCQGTSGEGKSTTVVPNSKFTGGTCKVGKIAGISVANIKITQQ